LRNFKHDDTNFLTARNSFFLLSGFGGFQIIKTGGKAVAYEKCILTYAPSKLIEIEDILLSPQNPSEVYR